MALKPLVKGFSRQLGESIIRFNGPTVRGDISNAHSLCIRCWLGIRHHEKSATSTTTSTTTAAALATTFAISLKLIQ